MLEGVWKRFHPDREAYVILFKGEPLKLSSGKSIGSKKNHAKSALVNELKSSPCIPSNEDRYKRRGGVRGPNYNEVQSIIEGLTETGELKIISVKELKN